ncbi:MAG: hypothetical protein Q8Q73_18970 [Stagnimonas sp.]|nr:hypothetical protein [Stagnimonas sp.]
MRKLLLVLLIGIGAWQALDWWLLRPVEQADGVLAPQDPAQGDAAGESPIRLEDYRLTPRARYQLRARLLSRRPYHFGREAELSPLDFALGWGVMSDNRVLSGLDIRQSGRFFRLRWDEQAPADEAEMMTHAANTHLIPANDRVRRALARMRPGQVVALDGWLVDAEGGDGWRWNTSLTRADTGAGACELFLVRSAGVVLHGH